jgi:hypothetical protein
MTVGLFNSGSDKTVTSIYRKAASSGHLRILIILIIDWPRGQARLDIGYFKGNFLRRSAVQDLIRASLIK